MVLNQKIINYIEFTDIPKTINSNLIITDLEKVIYNLNYDSEQNYKFNKLSTRIDELIVRWQTYDICENSFFISNDDSLKITENDIEKHSAIMIFPIYSCDKMEGLAVYFRNYGNYILSSTKAHNTIRKWIMKFLECSI